MDQPAKRPVVVDSGMHRSGAFLPANSMHAIGVDLGQDLMQPSGWDAGSPGLPLKYGERY